jgi:nucleolysin TIA-1/TIAR
MRCFLCFQHNSSSSSFQRRAHLYVGNLSPRVTEYMLTEIFAVAGPVQHVKIIPDKNYQHGGLNYGFVEYIDMRAAETALQTLNGRKIFDTEIRVNWAYQGSQNKEDTTGHYHVFVGDLSPEVNDEVLGKAFSAFGTLSDARVMWDMNSGKSRGYGFLAFRDKTDAEQAIATMNGEWLGSRAIRVNWANQKTQGLAGGTVAARPVTGGPVSGWCTGSNQLPGWSAFLRGRSPANACIQHDRLRGKPCPILHSSRFDSIIPIHWIPIRDPHAGRSWFCLRQIGYA